MMRGYEKCIKGEPGVGNPGLWDRHKFLLHLLRGKRSRSGLPQPSEGKRGKIHLVSMLLLVLIAKMLERNNQPDKNSFWQPLESIGRPRRFVRAHRHCSRARQRSNWLVKEEQKTVDVVTFVVTMQWQVQSVNNSSDHWLLNSCWKNLIWEGSHPFKNPGFCESSERKTCDF